MNDVDLHRLNNMPLAFGLFSATRTRTTWLCSVMSNETLSAFVSLDEMMTVVITLPIALDFAPLTLYSMS